MIHLGKVEEVKNLDNEVILDCNWCQHKAVHYGNGNRFSAKLSLKNVLPGVMHLQLLREVPWNKEEENKSYVVDRQNFDSLPLAVTQDENRIMIRSEKVDILIEKHPFHISFLDKNGDVLLRESSPGIEWEEWDFRLNFEAEENERFYGLGEADQDVDRVPFQLRGRSYQIHHKHLPAPSRLIFPVVMSSKNYAIVIDNPWIAEFDLDSNKQNKWSYRAQGGQISFYFIKGDNLYQIIERYVQLTGKPALPPKWTFGFMQSKYGYRNWKEVEDLVNTFKEKQIPIDTIILDLYWFKHMGDLTFDQENFPSPEEMIGKLREQGIKVILIEEPFVTIHSRLYKEGKEKGYFAARPTGEIYTLPFWAGESVLVDFTNPNVKEWWAAQHQPLIEMGIGGWWTDLNEPKIHPADMVHYDGPANKVHNIMALEMHKSLHQAYQTYAPNQRLFIMSRSGWMSMQKYGAGTWSGDVAANWEALRNQIALGLNLGLLGIPMWNTDIGGFNGEYPSAELYTRWLQLGAMTPIMRPHGDHQEREPWAYGPETEEIIKRYIHLRYQFIPYLYTYAFEAHKTGAPIMRPLILDYPFDENLYDITDQFLLGREILVAPVMEEGTKERRVYLPEGEWINFWTDEIYQGSQSITVDAPLEILPLFIKKGSIIPMAPNAMNVDEQKTLPINIHLYLDQIGEFNLYDDDGISTSYLQYSSENITRFKYNLVKTELTLQWENLKQSGLNFTIHLCTKPQMVLVNNQELKFDYTNNLLNFSVGRLQNGTVQVIY